jgi:amino acid permease
MKLQERDKQFKPAKRALASFLLCSMDTSFNDVNFTALFEPSSVIPNGVKFYLFLLLPLLLLLLFSYSLYTPSNKNKQTRTNKQEQTNKNKQTRTNKQEQTNKNKQTNRQNRQRQTKRQTKNGFAEKSWLRTLLLKLLIQLGMDWSV